MSIQQWQAGTIYLPGALVSPRTLPVITPGEIDNADFESGDSDWTKTGDFAIGVIDSFAGTQSAILETIPATYSTLENDSFAAVVPGQSITIKAMIHADTADQSISLGFRFYDAAFVSILKYGAGIDLTIHEWIEAISIYVAPVDTAYVRVYIQSNATNSVVKFDNFSWDLSAGGSTTGLIFKATQTDSGISGSEEPTWPTSVGGTVVDNEVTWEAVEATTVTWEARAILKSGATEPTWPLVTGAVVSDNNISWEAVRLHIDDPNCPHTKEVAIGASKIFAGDDDITRFSATLNPRDWTTPEDAGFLPTGLQQGAQVGVTALGVYRSNLTVWSPSSFQVWQIDPDPSAMALLDAMEGIGSAHHKAVQPVSNDLFFLAALGVRTVGVAAGSTNLATGDAGVPIDTLIQAEVESEGLFLLPDDSSHLLLPDGVSKLKIFQRADPLATYYPSAGQYWLAFPTHTESEPGALPEPEPEPESPLEPLDLSRLFYMQDFDVQVPEGTNWNANINYQMVNDIYGYGNTTGARTTAPNFADTDMPSGEGMHGDNAALCDGSARNIFDIDEGNSPDLPANWISVYGIDPHTHIMWFYITDTSSLAGITGTGGLETPTGLHTFINTDRTIEIDIGDFGTRESFTTVGKVTLNSWNFFMFSHNPDGKTVSVSITPEGQPTRNAPEVFPYTAIYENVTVGLLVCGVYDNGATHPFLAGSKIGHWSLWDYDMPEAEVDRIFNGGTGRTTAEFFGEANHNPAEALVGSSSLTRPRINLFIPGDWSTFKGTGLLQSSVANTTGDAVIGYLSEHIMGSINSGTAGPAPLIQENVQNGLSVLRVAGPTGQGLSQAWVGQSAVDATVFFAGSCTNSGAAGTIANLGESGQFKPMSDDQGRFGLNNGTIHWSDPSDDVGSGVFFIGAATYNGSTGEIKIFMNGALSASYPLAGVSSGTGGSGWLFADFFGASNPFEGDFGHLIGYTESFSDEDVITTMDWMNDIWAAY